MYPCGEKHYKVLMDEYPKVTAVFLSLKKEYRDVIADITKRMGEGMSSFIRREVVTLKDWNEYCHYVAGLVGIGLSNLWASSMLEDKRFADMEDLSNSMGLFLQKTNIIRDYLEDIVEEPAPRMFWPKCVWSKYAKTLDAFRYPENREKAVHCANHLITNALEHAGASLEYMSSLKNVDVFRFCAIPQVMAIATLAECYENGKVFEGVVKIRRGLSARIMLECLDIYDVARMFKTYARAMENKIADADPNASKTRKQLANVHAKCDDILRGDQQGFGNKFDPVMPFFLRLLVLLMTLLYAAYAFRVGGVREAVGVAAPGTGVAVVDKAEMAFSALAVGAASVFFATGHFF